MEKELKGKAENEGRKDWIVLGKEMKEGEWKEKEFGEL